MNLGKFQDVYFDGVNLNEIMGLYIYNHEFNEYPDRDIKEFPLARADKSVVTSARFIKKTLRVQFFIDGCNREESECIIADLKAATQKPNCILSVNGCACGSSDSQSVESGEGSIEYRDVTLQEIDLEQTGGKKYRLTLVFLAADPLAYGDNSVIVSGEQILNSPFATQLTAVGTYMEQEPIITLTVNNMTGNTDPNEQITININGRILVLHTTVATGDVLVIDSTTGIAQLNGLNVVTSGSFPILNPGDNDMTYTDTFSAPRDVTLDVQQTTRCL